MAFGHTRKWSAFWISFGQTLRGWRGKTFPAPYFRREFQYTPKGLPIKLYICGLGYYELYLNGRRIDDFELTPNPTNFDAHVGYLVYDLSDQLLNGKNTIGVILGNGLYNANSSDVWHFDKSTWRDYPKLLLEIKEGENTLLSSDDTWQVTTTGPIIFDSLRSGEKYDARLEMPGWNENNFDSSAWHNASIVPAPGGELFEQTSPSCRIKQTFLMRRLPCGVWDAGQNIAGRAQLTVRGERGACVKLQYGDVLNPDGTLYLKDISSLILNDEVQTEYYTLKGSSSAEIWQSRFTYHGFRYVVVEITGNAKILSMMALAIHSDFQKIGSFQCNNLNMNALEHNTCWSFMNNFVGIPTDCPHREKNGWLNDTQLASETGLFHFDLTEAYREWLGTIRDTQRPSGQLPGIAPGSGWGYNWGSGPLFDAAIFEIPRNIYCYRGDSSVMRENYEACRKSIEFSSQIAKGNILKFGLGDWTHPFPERAVPPELVTTAYFAYNCNLLADAAELFNLADDAKKYRQKALEITDAFNYHWSNGNGSYANDEQTALALAIFFGFCPKNEIQQAIERLEKAVRERNYTADFGIVGAKFVPRVLAKYGLAESAFRIFTQEEYPGWSKWVQDGETTLLESFAGDTSHCHIMFGDLSAWMMQFAAGIEPSFHRPGFSSVVLRPASIPSLNSMQARYQTIHGMIEISWKRNKNEVVFSGKIPQNTPGTLILPNGTEIAFQEQICMTFQG